VEPGGKEDTRVDAPMVESTVEAVHGVVSDPELLRLRRALPLNGETAFADTAAAFAALSPSEQELLSRTRVVRRVNPGDAGTISPLVVANPRTGVRSLHSPIFDARPGVRPAIQVDGMSVEDSRLFLDRLEAHCLQPCFRYDHLHTPGDVTIWDLFSTLHCIPPQLRSVNSLGDVRLLYRISTKGEPCIELPRKDDEDWLSEHIAGGWRTELAPSHTV
jgi:alpha-ketoglutarate-dependent taurine dioxygenase